MAFYDCVRTLIVLSIERLIYRFGGTNHEESKRPSRKANKVQYMRHSSKKDCYKYSFVPRSIVQWNNINAPDDHAQFKSMLSLIDLRIGGDTYKY